MNRFGIEWDRRFAAAYLLGYGSALLMVWVWR